jgi:hypothetical protein
MGWQRWTLGVVALSIASIGVVVPATSAQAVADSWTGCTYGVDQSGVGARAWAQCGGHAGFTRFQAWAVCKSGSRVYGPWMPDNYSRSTTSRCYTGVKTYGAIIE